MKPKLAVTLFGLYCLIFATLASRAMATDTALSASPAILETVLNDSKPTETTITIQNNTNFPLPVKGSVSTFLSTEDIPVSAKDTYNASRWFKLEPTDFILQPNETKSINVIITPSNGAEPGGHYATIYFRPLIPQEAVSSATAVSLARIGVLTFLIVPGDIHESLSSLALHAPAFAAFGPVKFWHSLENQGSIHLLPKSTLTITNLIGRTVATITNNPSIVLPHTTKDNNFTWNTKLGFGPYHATVTTNYGTDQKPLNSNTITFWLFPWPIVLLLAIVLTLVYKLFIVNGRRIALAYRVLKGNYDPTQKNPTTHRSNSGRRHRASSSLPRRSPRPGRQLDRQ